MTMHPKSRSDRSIREQIDRLDREWHETSRRYVMTDEDGDSHVPNSCQIAAVTLVAVAGGVAWTYISAMLAAPGPVTVFGLVFAMVSIMSGSLGMVRATEYERKRRHYHERRAALVQCCDEGRSAHRAEPCGGS